MKLALLALVLMLFGCGAFSRFGAQMSGYNRVCVEGVSYLQFPSGVTVEYEMDGRLKLCKRGENDN